MVNAVNLHLFVDGTCHDVTRSQRESLVVFLHETLSVGQTQDASVAAHGLGDEVGGMRLVGVMQHRGMELYELHVGHRSLGAIHHGDAVARSDDGVRGCQVHGSATSRAHHGDLREIGVHLLCFRVQHVGPVAVDIGRAACDACSQVVLGDDFHGEVVLLHVDVGIVAHGLHQSALYLGTRIIGMVKDTEFRVSALTMKVERTVLLTVEVHAPVDEFLNLGRRIPYHLLHGGTVRDIVASHHRVLDMLLEVVHFEVGHRGHASLGKRSIGLFKAGLADHANLAFLLSCHFQGIAHTGHSGTDNEEIVFVYHTLSFQVCWCKDSANRRQYKINSFIFIVEMQPIFTA